MIFVTDGAMAKENENFSSKLPIKVPALEIGQKHVKEVMQTHTVVVIRSCYHRGLAPTGPTGQTRWEERCICAEPWTGLTLSTLLMTPRNNLAHRILRTNGYDS